MYILGISCFYHDSAAALIKDGIIVAAAAEERFSRKKHDNGFPGMAIKFCIDKAEIEPGDIEYVVFYEKPLIKFERVFLSSLATFPKSWRAFSEAMINYFYEKLWIKNLIMRELNIEAERVLFIEHHISHAASALFVSPFKQAAILTIDGVGEWTTASFGRGTAQWDGRGVNSIDLLGELRFPHSVGLLYFVLDNNI